MGILSAVFMSLACLLTGCLDIPGPGVTAVGPGQTILLDEDVAGDPDFILEAFDTLVIRRSLTIRAQRAVILKGKVRVELPEDAPPGAWGPRLTLQANGLVAILGEMSFADGRDGKGAGAMGGVGSSLALRAPITVVAVPALTMGDGGDGGPNVEGGGGGIVEAFGFVLPTNPEGLTISGGRGGDGGDGSIGTKLHPRGHRGGYGGCGGIAAQYNPILGTGGDPFDQFAAIACAILPELEEFLSDTYRSPAPLSSMVGGNGGDGGRGGAPWDEMPNAGGGMGGDGGYGGFSMGLWGIPGTRAERHNQPHPAAVEGLPACSGMRGGASVGGDGGDGGDMGPGMSNYIFGSAIGGRGGDGGRASGGRGGDAGNCENPNHQTGPGPGGNATGGRGGSGGAGHSGGSGGAAGYGDSLGPGKPSSEQ